MLFDGATITAMVKHALWLSPWWSRRSGAAPVPPQKLIAPDRANSFIRRYPFLPLPPPPPVCTSTKGRIWTTCWTTSAPPVSISSSIFTRISQNRLHQLPVDRLTPEDRADFTILEDQCNLSPARSERNPYRSAQPHPLRGDAGQRAVQPLRAGVRAQAAAHPEHHGASAEGAAFPRPGGHQPGVLAGHLDAGGAGGKPGQHGPGGQNHPRRSARRICAIPTRASPARPWTPCDKFQDYLQNSLSARADADWRLGQDRYTRKFRYQLETGVEADTTLADAEQELAKVRARMLELALPLRRQGLQGTRAGDARARTR